MTRRGAGAVVLLGLTAGLGGGGAADAWAGGAEDGRRGLAVSQRRMLAVTIGIDRYRRMPLRRAVSDARRVALVLSELGFSVKEVHDEQASRAGLRDLFSRQLPAQLQPADRLVVYFAGHGFTDKPGQPDAMGYLMPVDGDMSNPARVKKTGISMASLTTWLSERRLRARQVMVLVDACYAGLALPGQRMRSPMSNDLARVANTPATVILSAGDEGQEAVETDKGGLFTGVLLEALTSSKADRNRDGFLTGTELSAYVTRQVPRRARRSRHAQQPQMARVGSGDFVLALRGQELPTYGQRYGDMVVIGKAPALLLDATEITVGEFRECVEDGVCRGEGTGMSPLCNARRPGSDKHPMNCVSLWQARDYCRWRRKRLPTVAEWKMAAAGKGRKFAWGNQGPDCQRAVMYGVNGRGCGAGTTAQVASLPLGRSPEGVYDLLGNVREWALPADSDEAAAYEAKPFELVPVFGGAWHQGQAAQTAEGPAHLLSADADEFTGFRCATTR